MQTLAMESPWQYVYETTVFFYVYHVAQDVINSGRGHVYEFFLLNLRAFGSLFFMVPLVLGQLPGDFMKGYDLYCKYYFGAILSAYVLSKNLPRDMRKYLTYPAQLFYAVFTANACCKACEAGVAALPGSYVAPVAIGFFGVCGHTLIESGINGSLGVSEFNPDQFLGIFGSVTFLAATMWYPLGVHVVILRCLLVLFRLAADYYDFNEVTDYCQSVVNMLIRKIPKSRR